MIVVTGAAGFIGSCMVSYLKRQSTDIVVSDNFSGLQKNISLLEGLVHVDRTDLISWLGKHREDIEAIYHLGARTDTTESDWEVFEKLNLDFSKSLWNLAARFGIPFLYASSAATYGNGDFGYSDDHDAVANFQPMNPYGKSKQLFDEWALKQEGQPPRWYGLKFFNVFGPNEYHKGRMASVVFHAFNQIKEHGSLKLFRSHREDFEDGQQKRDFVYVKDVIEICQWLINTQAPSGIYNLGSGQARTFLDLANAVFNALGQSPQIEFIDIPEDIRENYQYFTEAEMVKIRQAGYSKPLYSLEDGISDYVVNYLQKGLKY